VILRPAVVYGGSGDTNGVLFGRLVCAACYCAGSGSADPSAERLPGEMTVMWDRHMKVNTVHVLDVCRAVWLAGVKAPGRSVWNLCDKSDTDQGKVSEAKLS
jgi:nucleoside-diphosphate-sugar epimerase